MNKQSGQKGGATWHHMLVGAIFLMLAVLAVFWLRGAGTPAERLAAPPPVLVYDREALFVRLREDFEARGEKSLLREPELAESIEQILDRAAADTGALILDGQYAHRVPASVDITENVYRLLQAMQEE